MSDRRIIVPESWAAWIDARPAPTPAIFERILPVLARRSTDPEIAGLYAALLADVAAWEPPPDFAPRRRGPKIDARRAVMAGFAAWFWYGAFGRGPRRSRPTLGGPLTGPFPDLLRELFAAAAEAAPPSEREILRAIKCLRVNGRILVRPPSPK